MQLPIYLDYAATTPMDPRVSAKMSGYLTLEGVFGNPASVNHRFGRDARDAVERARRQIAALIEASPAQIVWTSGTTESNNLAIKGAAHHGGKKHIITCGTEHSAVLDVCARLETEGFEITRLTPDRRGILNPGLVGDAIRADTGLVSIMHVNNETGVIQDLAEIGRTTTNHNIPLHVDAAQSAGKVRIDVDAMHLDLVSLNAHKLYGPKGIGALYLRNRALLGDYSLLQGGGQESGLRAGTLPTHQIVGMGEAFAVAAEQLEEDDRRIRGLKERLWNGLKTIAGAWLNGSLEHSVAGILNVGFGGIDSEDLLLALPDIALSTGAACGSGSAEPSHVLRAMGLEDERINSTVRFGLGRFTTEQEIDYVVRAVQSAVEKLRDSQVSRG